ncbi:MAG: hypothetical protein IPH42_21600 [Bacteroidetes bacterium]|nr:hypothetical protein [Bacteroidota bacterium]
MKNIIIILFIFRLSNVFSQNSLTTFLNQYNQSGQNLTIISISGTECVNCYASIHNLIDELKLEKSNTLFLIKDVPKRELVFFMEDKFSIDTAKYSVVIDNALFKELNSNSGYTSSISICNSKDILFQTSFKNLDLVSLKKYYTNKIDIKLSDSLDISSFAGAGASTLQVKNDSTIFVYNYFRNTIFEFNSKSASINRSVGWKNLISEVDNFLSLSELEKFEIDFASTNTDAQQMFKNVPSRISPRGVYVTDNYIYLPLEILSYDLVIHDNKVPVDTAFQLKWFSFFAKYDMEWNLVERYSFPYQIPEFKGFFNYLPSGQFLNDSVFVMRTSTPSSDSLAIKYILPQNSTAPRLENFLSVKYPEHFQVISKGMRNVYTSKTINDNYYFNAEPIIYNDELKSKFLLEGWEYQPVSDSTKTNVWIDVIHQLPNGSYLVLGTKNYTSTWYALYDQNFILIEQKKIIDRPLISLVIKNDKIWGMDLTDEYGTLYSYEIVFQ